MNSSVCQSAPAKLNLTLKVLGRRGDGTHELDSLVVFARDVADAVTLIPGDTHNVTFSGPFGSGLLGSDFQEGAPTTVSEALRLLSQLPRSELPLELQLGDVGVEKNIPLASGLGGGSADAAAVLRAVMDCNPTCQNGVAWQALARQIGADVPVCLASNAQIMAGTGDKLESICQFPKLYAVLIKTDEPAIANKTQRVFAALKAQPVDMIVHNRLNKIEFRFDHAEDVAQFVRETGNQLLAPARALMSSLELPLAALKAQPSCQAVSLSGAGPTVFGLFKDRVAADTAARDIQTSMPAWWVKVSELV